MLKKKLRAGWDWGSVGARACLYGPPAIVAARLLRNKAIGREMMYRWCSGSVDAIGIDLDWRHNERLDGVGQAIFVANHQSVLDILVIGARLRHDFRWLAKSAVFKVPMLGGHLKASGHIPVFRGAEKARNADIGDRIQAVVDEGASVLFFAEGTRSEDGTLKPFRSGAFMAAARGRIPVVPLVVEGTHRLMDRDTPFLRHDTGMQCSVTVLDPVHAPADVRDQRARADMLRYDTFAAMSGVLHPGKVVNVGDEAHESRMVQPARSAG
ncbi:MAG: 1-acyl-sn-glycerol-3-phosphate acyltransferase [Bradymonadia bacterium]